MAAGPPPGFIIFGSQDPPLRVFARLGADGPVLENPNMGWTEVARPRRVALTDYMGHSPMRQTIPMILDGLHNGRVQEPFIRNIERLFRPSHGNYQPSVIYLQGAGLYYTNLNWVIESIEWDATPIKRPDGRRIRQGLTIVFLQYIPDKRLELRANANAARRKKEAAKRRAAKKRYTVKKGEHLGEIAAKQLGDPQRWREIAKLNGIRDPSRVKAGQVIRMP